MTEGCDFFDGPQLKAIIRFGLSGGSAGVASVVHCNWYHAGHRGY